MEYIHATHPIEQIRVVWHIEKMGGSYKVLEPRAHCIGCNTNLQPTDKQAIFAIDLVMVNIGRKERNAATA